MGLGALSRVSAVPGFCRVGYREALKEYSRETAPLYWAMTQSNLAIVLRILREREANTRRLEEPVVAYREALTQYTPEATPEYWKPTTNALEKVLALIERQSR